MDHLSIASGLFQGNEYGAAVKGDRFNSFVDVGCNAGWFTLWLVARPVARPSIGILIDANPSMVADARWHIERNGLDAYEVVLGAVGLPADQPSTTFYLNPSSAASSVLTYRLGKQLPLKGRVNAITVPTISVGNEWRARFGNAAVDLMKIDIEGKELDFIAVEHEFIRNCVRTIVVEWHKWQVSKAQLDQLLTTLGFSNRGSFGETDLVGLATYDNLENPSRQ